jgi:Ca-activated chloride channel family protein
MTFGAQKILWLLIAVIPVVWIMRFAWGQASARMRTFGQAGDAPRRMARGRVRRERVVMLVAMAGVVVALAGPRRGFDEVEVQSSGADIFVALDLSSSMQAGDLRPTRFDRARREVFDLLDVVSGSGRADRVGLVGFAGVSFVRCPLTADTNAVREYLMLMSPGDMPVQGTDIGGAIMTALNAMDAGGVGPDVAATRAIILISDGEDLEGAEAAAIKEAKARGVRVFTVGVGTQEGAPVPDGRGGFKKDARGNVIVSKFASDALREIASETGGEYVEPGSGGRVQNMDFVAVLGEAVHESGKVKFWHEKYQWPLAVAAVAIAGLGIMTLAPSSAVAMLLVFAVNGVGLGGEARAADVMPERQRMHTYNEGIDAYESGEFDKARELFGKAAAGEVAGDAAARALYNSGNAAVGAGDLDSAEKAYEEALKMTPDDKEAAENLAWVKEQKKQKQDQKQQQQGQKSDQTQRQEGPGDKDQNQDQKNQEQSQEQNQDQKQSQGREQQQQQGQKRAQQEGQQQQGQNSVEQHDRQATQSRALSKEEASRILNSVDDLKSKYLYFVLPKDQQQKAATPPEKDW